MITIIAVIVWFAFGLMAAGWMKADFDAIKSEPENGLAIFLIVAGPFGVFAGIIERITSREAHGWKWPFAKSPCEFTGYWFKQDEGRQS